MLEVYKNKREINREPQRVRYQREVELPDGLLTLEDIGKYLKEGEKFGFFQKEEGGLGLPVNYLNIHGYRDETKEEIDVRVAKAEAYNKKCDEYNLKHSK